MAYSDFFEPGRTSEIQEGVTRALNERTDLVVRAGSSASVAADHIEEAVRVCLKGVLGKDCVDFDPTATERSLQDAAFLDRFGYNHIVNIKGQNLGRKFHMPNLISAERLTSFLEEALTRRQHYNLLIVRYALDGGTIRVRETLFFPIEWIRWGCLAIQAQGEGVLQLRDGLKIQLDPEQDRGGWNAELMRRHSDYLRKLAAKSLRKSDRVEARRRRWVEAKGHEVYARPVIPAGYQSSIFDEDPLV